ncbi:MAG: hypothetical protein K9L66_07150 [Spirochaetaceae bacterium]|nr:hypothetical protein [Spirochaetaceae bacterium]MCF7939021.1 hypothetical protein [Spirochaetales bacterium]
MLSNLHPDFNIRGITCRLEESAPQLSREDVEGEVQNLHRKLTEAYGKLERSELKRLDMLQPFVRYFKQFKKTYHLFLQLESFVHKNRPLPFITPLVTAYFLSELETGVLASAHDLDKIVPELSLEKAAGDEGLTLLSGEARTAPAGDALLKDAEGLLTCVIQGQDTRTLLGPKSRSAAYFVYGPPGVSDQTLTQALGILSDHLKSWYGAYVHIEDIEKQ